MGTTTYSRTSGFDLLPGTWSAARAQGDIPADEILDPTQRFDYHNASAVDRAAMNRLMMEAHTRPPDFLRFALREPLPGEQTLAPYPGTANEARGRPADGHIENMHAEHVAAWLCISESELRYRLHQFSGQVQCVALPVGTKLYRAAELKPKAPTAGVLANKMLGQWWESSPPRERDDAKVRRIPGGYVSVELRQETVALSGKAAHLRDSGADSLRVFVPLVDDFYIDLDVSGTSAAELPVELRQAFGGSV